MARTLTVAVAQPATTDNVEDNAAEHARLITVAHEESGATLVIFPELSLTGYLPTVSPVSLDSPTWEPIISACKKSGATALVGSVTEGTYGRCISTVAVTGEGVAHAYRKASITPEEAEYFVPGPGPAAVEVDGVKVGLAICGDVWADAYLGAYSGLPMDLFAASLRSPAQAHWEAHELGARLARTWGIPVAFAQTAGPISPTLAESACGHSAVYVPDTDPETEPVDNPESVIVAEASAEPSTYAAATLTFGP